MPQSRLFQRLRVGDIELEHRLVMAPLTRFRADDDHVHQPMAAAYYAQRGSVPGTLLITEATFVSKRAGGYANVPGIWSRDQINAWQKVTTAVHAKGSYIFCQLWALGRAADAEVAMAEGFDVVSSSAVPIDSDHAMPKEMTIAEIESFQADYVQAARNAIEAGFDGVEVHGANGYLIDQFTQDTCNIRRDRYGGSIANRARFLLEVTSLVASAIGSTRVGLRLSPFSIFQSMKMDDPIPQFSYLLDQLKPLQLAYLHLVESRISGPTDAVGVEKLDFAIDLWKDRSPIVIAGGFTPATAEMAVDDQYRGQRIAIAFGRHFISNPDLPYRIRHGIELSDYNRDTFYIPKSEKGYTDYPFSSKFRTVGSNGKL